MANPNPKDGFAKNPQNINTKGRPKKGYSITEWFKGMLNSKPEVKDAIGKSIVKKALEGDVAAQKMVWNYMDGMPKETVDKGNTNILMVNDAKLARQIVGLFGQPQLGGDTGEAEVVESGSEGGTDQPGSASENKQSQ